MGLTRSDRHADLLRPDDTLVVAIDMQEPFLREAWERERVVGNVALLAKAAAVLRVPVVPTLQYQDRMGPVVPEVARALPSQCVPFDKMCFSCMGDPAFASELQRSGRRQVLLCGVETHICVSQTAHDLLAQGYRVHVASDAVSSRTRENWKVGLKRMAQAGALVSSTEMAVFELLNEAGTPEFREILGLIK